MNAKKFSDAMSELDTKYVDEALNYKKKAKKPIWVKWGAIAACLCFYIDKREQLPSSFVLHQYLKVSTEENIFSSGAALVQGLMKVHGKSISQKDFRDRINYVKRKSNWKDADFQTWRLILKRVLSNSAESLDDFIRSEEGGEFEIF